MHIHKINYNGVIDAYVTFEGESEDDNVGSL